MKTILTSLVLVFAMLTGNAQSGPLMIFNNTSHDITITNVRVIFCSFSTGIDYVDVPVNMTIGSMASSSNSITINPVSTSPDADWAEIRGWHTDLPFTFEAPYSNCLIGTTESGYLNISWNVLGNTHIASIVTN